MSGLDGLVPLNRAAVPQRGELAMRAFGDEAPPADLDFGAALQSAMRGVTELQGDAEDQALALARGEPVHMHDVLVAMGKSEVAFDMMLEVRNRLLNAWETLSRSVM
jgi:flagellar hook-basal body complex protein FliE